MFFKIAVIVILLIIVSSLASGLFFLVNDKSQNKRTLKALTIRIGLSAVLFALLLLGWALGLISPHGVYPPVPPP